MRTHVRGVYFHGMSWIEEASDEGAPRTGMRSGDWSTAVANYRGALKELLSLDPLAADPWEMGNCVVEWEAARPQAVAVEATMLLRFERSQEWRADGSKSLASWLAARSKTPKRVLGRLVVLARRLAKMPKVKDALGEGKIDRSAAEELGRLVDSPRQRVRSAFVEAEEELVRWASEMREDDFARATAMWRDSADPDGGEDQASKDFDNRKVHLSKSFNGNWFLDGRFDPIGGGELAEALRRIEEELFKTDWAAAKDLHGDGVKVEDLARTPAQRRADAMVEMARRAVAAPIGANKPRPLISVLVGYETMHGPVRETFNRTVVSTGTVARLLGEADVERVVFGPDSRDITDLGRKARFFTDAQRRVIELRDRVCYHPSCDTPAEQCEMDHIQAHGLGGDTNVDNGRPACKRHNNDRNKGDPP